jgi:hypothetical protein
MEAAEVALHLPKSLTPSLTEINMISENRRGYM